MFGIGKLLFGEKKQINISELGVFNARIKSVTQKDIIWSGTVNSKKDNNKLIILLVGNIKGPYSTQIETVKSIINNLESVNKEIIELINDELILKKKFEGQKISDFNLVCINSWLKNEISFELTFESRIDDGYVGAIFKNGKISEVNL